MTHKNKLWCLADRYKKDEEGSLALTFAVSALTLIMATGAAYDISQLHSSKAKAQLVSDSVGLTATAYVKNHGKPPQNSKDGFQHNKTYSAKEQGFTMGKATNGDNDVKFKVVYDDKKGEATVYMKGEMATSFMGMFGQNKVSFTNKTVVKYSQSDNGDPASIFLVVDNSGSMAWHDKRKKSRGARSPAGAKPRIDGAKAEIKKFNAYLQDSLEGKSKSSKSKGKRLKKLKKAKDSQKFLRMGMTAYSSGMLSHLTVNPRWGTIPSSSVNRLRASGGTYPDTAVTAVESWMKKEDKIHKAVNKSKKPLKYVIFMTDGVNSSSTTERRTLQSCARMKAEGIQIYTIGFALEPGYYRAYYDWQTYQMRSYNSTRAYNFLKECASSPDHFVKAEDTSALNEAFDKIGEDIIADVIRIAS